LRKTRIFYFLFILFLFQIGWVKADTKAIQAIGMHVITNNDRITVSHEARSKFYLHVIGAKLEDAGPYMCQINSLPVKKQVHLRQL
jgi:neurotrimin